MFICVLLLFVLKFNKILYICMIYTVTRKHFSKYSQLFLFYFISTKHIFLFIFYYYNYYKHRFFFFFLLICHNSFVNIYWYVWSLVRFYYTNYNDQFNVIAFHTVTTYQQNVFLLILLIEYKLIIIEYYFLLCFSFLFHYCFDLIIFFGLPTVLFLTFIAMFNLRYLNS